MSKASVRPSHVKVLFPLCRCIMKMDHHCRILCANNLNKIRIKWQQKDCFCFSSTQAPQPGWIIVSVTLTTGTSSPSASSWPWAVSTAASAAGTCSWMHTTLWRWVPQSAGVFGCLGALFLWFHLWLVLTVAVSSSLTGPFLGAVR